MSISDGGMGGGAGFAPPVHRRASEAAGGSLSCSRTQDALVRLEVKDGEWSEEGFHTGLREDGVSHRAWAVGTLGMGPRLQAGCVG